MGEADGDATGTEHGNLLLVINWRRRAGSVPAAVNRSCATAGAGTRNRGRRRSRVWICATLRSSSARLGCDRRRDRRAVVLAQRGLVFVGDRARLGADDRAPSDLVAAVGAGAGRRRARTGPGEQQRRGRRQRRRPAPRRTRVGSRADRRLRCPATGRAWAPFRAATGAAASAGQSLSWSSPRRWRNSSRARCN